MWKAWTTNKGNINGILTRSDIALEKMQVKMKLRLSLGTLRNIYQGKRKFC